MKSAFLTLCLFLAFLSGILANNVTMSNISLDGQTIANHTCNIKFDISWENSWRTSTTVPGNWDACWVFAKYRVAGGPWHHCTLSTNVNDYTCPGGCTINPVSDGKGVFIYRSQDGSGNNDWTLLTLRWKYGLDGVNDDAEVEVKLFAIEMVYITQGDFYIGDGNGSDESEYAFHTGSTIAAVQITSNMVPDIQVDGSSTYDDAELKDGIGIDGDGGIDPDNDGTIDNAFYPTGYRAYYIMKYEISQEQYMEFLNTLTRAQQQARIETDISGTSVTNVYVMSNTINPYMYHNMIRCDFTIPSSPQPVTFYCDFNINGTMDPCDGQTLVCNLLSWPDGCAYADWAGLRPLSEIEYEKATRGPNYPVLGEYAWGNTNITASGLSLTDYGCPYSDIHLEPDQNTGRSYYYGTYIPPAVLMRCGGFASSSVNHTRQETGAGYYGVMEMSGSMSEPVVSLGNVAGRSYRAIDGNGELNAAGYADVDYWPGINGNNQSWTASGLYGGTTGVTEAAGSGIKGGSIGTYAFTLCISYRYFASMGYPETRQSIHGGRYVRNAP
jgi:formylglycine-generating enzyme required for sulfatase activity